jgi:hypothetical protein
MPGVLGLRIFEATGADIADLGEEHDHRGLRVCGKDTEVVLAPMPPAVGRAIDQATGSRTRRPILLNSRGARMDRHPATRRLYQLAQAAGIQVTRTHPHVVRHTTMFNAGVDSRDVQIAARHADPRITMRYDKAPPEPGPPPQLHPGRLYGLRHLIRSASPAPLPRRREAARSASAATVGRQRACGRKAGDCARNRPHEELTAQGIARARVVLSGRLARCQCETARAFYGAACPRSGAGNLLKDQ